MVSIKYLREEGFLLCMKKSGLKNLQIAKQKRERSVTDILLTTPSCSSKCSSIPILSIQRFTLNSGYLKVPWVPNNPPATQEQLLNFQCMYLWVFQWVFQHVRISTESFRSPLSMIPHMLNLDKSSSCFIETNVKDTQNSKSSRKLQYFPPLSAPNSQKKDNTAG